MLTTLLKAKLHRVSVTHAELDYEGSCAIDHELLEMAGLHDYEQLHIYNVTNGERFVTYAMRAEAGSGIISINGAAAHKARVNDLIIICAYGIYSAEETREHQPMMLYFKNRNQLSHTSRQIPEQLA